jgi:hypothetical protein
MAVAALDLQVTERRERRARLVAVAPPPGLSPSELLAHWNNSWSAALDALDGAVRIGALSPAEGAVRRRRIHVEQELIAGELQGLAHQRNEWKGVAR